MKYGVITGAADGIGRALAHRYATAGYHVVGIDVDADQAARTQAARKQEDRHLPFIIADLATEAGITEVLDHLAAGPAIDVFIHNAGINAVGRFAESDMERQRMVIAVNLLAPMLLTAGLLRASLLAPRSSLVFISSLSRFVGYPGAAVYAASKDGLASYARSLSVSLAAQDIHVLTVYPGPTRTAHARRYSPDNRREQRRMPPERLAAMIMRAVERRQRHLIPGVANQIIATAGHYIPSLGDFLMRKALLEPFDKRQGA